MSKVAVVFWSGTGNTQTMADAVAAGAQGAGAEVDVKTDSEFGAADVASYDAIAFGCPAMGAEVLEESEFQPMFDDVKGELSGKKIALFGSYGWGDGEWMRNWEADCRDAGANLAVDSVTANNEPDDDALDACIDKIIRQIRKNKTRLAKQLRDNTLTDSIESAPDEQVDYEVIKHKSFELRPMSVEEAILQMNMLSHEFFMFKNADTGDVNVVYKRSDDNYAVLEPRK